jgi:hypothetical protein
MADDMTEYFNGLVDRIALAVQTPAGRPVNGAGNG